MQIPSRSVQLVTRGIWIKVAHLSVADPQPKEVPSLQTFPSPEFEAGLQHSVGSWEAEAAAPSPNDFADHSHFTRVEWGDSGDTMPGWELEQRPLRQARTEPCLRLRFPKIDLPKFTMGRTPRSS